MSKHSGRSTYRYRTLKRKLREQHNPCWLCGQAINYDLPPDDPMSFSVDHVEPHSLNEQLREDPANLRAAHLTCNKRRGNGPPPPGIGMRSRRW